MLPALLPATMLFARRALRVSVQCLQSVLALRDLRSPEIGSSSSSKELRISVGNSFDQPTRICWIIPFAAWDTSSRPVIKQTSTYSPAVRSTSR
jgi:hypothetical protein